MDRTIRLGTGTVLHAGMQNDWRMIEVTPRGFEAPDLPPSSAFDQCVRCGLCLPTCPTYLETMTETSSPRGRISLIKSVSEGRLDLLSPGFVHQMSECLDCRACQAVCPSGVDYGALIENARAQVERAQAQTRPPLAGLLRSVLLRGLFAHLDRMRALAAVVRFAQRTGLEGLAKRLGLMRLLGMEAAAEIAPRMSDRFFVPAGQRYETPNAKAIAFLHVGCVMQVAFARVHEASVRVLQR
ncbi:MAG TPA: 4Fe-4S dicluster domain-containing protein, partial [Candidatus Baltobacteraceae bacterium]